MFSSFKQTLLGAGEMVRASFPFWSLKQSVSTCLNCFRPRGLKLKKNVIIICGCYAWFAVTWQGGHVGGQYNKQCFEEFIWIWLLVPSGEAILFAITNMAAGRHVQTSNAIGHFRVPRTLTFRMRPSAQPFLWKSFSCEDHFQLKG